MYFYLLMNKDFIINILLLTPIKSHATEQMAGNHLNKYIANLF